MPLFPNTSKHATQPGKTGVPRTPWQQVVSKQLLLTYQEVGSDLLDHPRSLPPQCH